MAHLLSLFIKVIAVIVIVYATVSILFLYVAIHIVPLVTVTDLSKTFSPEPSGAIVYLGDTAMFECHIDGAPEPHVTWYKDDQEIVPVDGVVQHLDGVLEVTLVRFSDFGRYYCKAENVERSRETEIVQLEQNGDACEYIL